MLSEPQATQTQLGEPTKATSKRAATSRAISRPRCSCQATLAHKNPDARAFWCYADAPLSPARRRVYATQAHGQPAQVAYGTPAPAAAIPVAVAPANLDSGASSILSGISPTLTSAAARLIREVLGLWSSSSGSAGSSGSSGSAGISAATFSSGFLSDYRNAFESASSADGEDGTEGTGGSRRGSRGECDRSPVSDGGADADHIAADEEHVPPQMPTVEPSGAGARRRGDEEPLNRELAY